MKDKLISEYISRMTYNDISNFAVKQGVLLNDSELRIIYDNIKNNYRTIIYGNPSEILSSIKTKVEPLTYSKIEELYIKFKDKYQSYL